MQIQNEIGFSEEQMDLQDIATKLCLNRSPIEKVRHLILDDLGYEKKDWREIVDLGWLGIGVPEEYGGVGLSLKEVVPIVEQMGRRLMASPFVSSTLFAQAILLSGNKEQKERLLPDVIKGKPATLALSEDHADWNLQHIDCFGSSNGETIKLNGTKTLVTDAKSAEWFLVSITIGNDPAFVILNKSQLLPESLRRENIIDETRRSYQLSLDGISVTTSDIVDSTTSIKLFDFIHLASNLMLSAEMCGATASVIDYTAEYLKTRKQFGNPIGSYQALKHSIVDCYVEYEKARSHLYYAAHTFNQLGEGEISTRMAKATACSAFSHAADRAIQFHGGFGFTYDCDAQLYRRRSIWCEFQHGDGAFHRSKLAELLLN